MVPNNSTKKYSLSTLKTLTNIFDELLIIADEKKENIILQNWDKIYELANKQEDINQHFDLSMLHENQNYTNLDKKDIPKKNLEILDLQIKLRDKIREYNEKEELNTKLLNDVLFIAKQKVEKFFNSYIKKATYSRKTINESNLWNDNPIMLDKFV